MARGTATAVHPGLADAQIVLGDVSVAGQIEKALEEIDVVVHLAGHSGAGSSVDDPLYDLQTNVGGMVTLLEAVRRSNHRVRVVFPGSRLEYGRAESLPVAESHPLRPLSPYGVDKIACEQYLDFYARAHGISYAVARLTNPYGPWIARPAREYNVLNRMIATAREGGTLTIYGDGAQLRDYLYVDDAVEAFVLLAALQENVVANVGSGTGIALRAAAETIVRVSGRGDVRSIPWPETAQKVETGDFVADISRIRSLGWEPKIGLEDGIRLTIEQSGEIA